MHAADVGAAPAELEVEETLLLGAAGSLAYAPPAVIVAEPSPHRILPGAGRMLAESFVRVEV